MTMVSLTAVEPLEPGFVTLTWDDGVTREVDISDLMTGHAVLEMLQIPEIFRAVSLVEGGGGIEWENGADFCAQALRRHSDEQQLKNSKVDA